MYKPTTTSTMIFDCDGKTLHIEIYGVSCDSQGKVSDIFSQNKP